MGVEGFEHYLQLCFGWFPTLKRSKLQDAVDSPVVLDPQVDSKELAIAVGVGKVAHK